MKGILQGGEETTHDGGKGSFQSPYLPARAFSSASLTSSRESERAEQHHAARTLHKQKTQPQTVAGTAPSTDFPQMPKGDLLSPFRSSLFVSCSSLQRQSSHWAQAAISLCDLSRRVCTTQCRSPVLVPRCRAKRILTTCQRRAQVAH